MKFLPVIVLTLSIMSFAFADDIDTAFTDTSSANTSDSAHAFGDTLIVNTTETDSTQSSNTPDTISTDTVSSSPPILFGIPQTFSLYEKRVVASVDSLIAPSDSLASSLKTSLHDDGSNLVVSGYKTFGVSVGELGEVNLEQGLEVTIGGEIRPGTTLEAYLSDQGSSIEGSTREISDFDMVNVLLKNKNFTVVAGDQVVSQPDSGILSGQKKIVGMSASVAPAKYGSRAAVSAFGAFSGGNHTVQTIRGREGVQGPYYLTGRGEANIITPIDGTVRVRVNGKNLTEGREEDFVVDYDVGAVIFNPRVLINGDDLIRVEYEYKSFDYRRTFVGGGLSWRSIDSTVSIRGNIWSESDNKDQPIEMELSDRDREILKNSGRGEVLAALSARPVHSLDVARMSVYYPLYKKAVDAGSGDTILVYAPYDPLRPDDVNGFYTASFTPAQGDGADYVIDNSIDRGQLVYKYVGRGGGDHTALAPIAAPMRETAGEIEARLRLRRVRATLNVVGKEHDKNLFSNIDNREGGNLSSAVRFKLGAGKKQLDTRTAWADFDYRFRSRNFTNEILSADDRKEGWGVSDAATGAGGAVVDATAGRQYQSWETTVGATVITGAAIAVGAGQAFVDSLTETEKVSGAAELLFMRDIMKLNLDAAVFRHHLSDIDISYRRSAKLTAQKPKKWETSVKYSDEWRTDTSGGGGGHIAGTVEAAYHPMGLKQSFGAAQYRKGEGFPGSADTGYALTWNQSATLKPLSAWILTGDSRWRYTQIDGEASMSTFLMSAVSEIAPAKSGFSSRQEYRVSRELASRFEQKMYYVGKGLGTHAFDSVAGEFRPSVNGDHVIQEVEIYDNTGGDAAVRKTSLNADWHFRPAKKIKGILNDLTWNGVLSVEEHIDVRNDRFVSYIPGYLSLFPPKNKKNGNVSGDDNSYYNGMISKDNPYQTGMISEDNSHQSSMISQNNPYQSDMDHSDNPHYSDIVYRQDVEYHVKGSPYKSRLYLLPGMRIVRGYEERSFETALRVERKKNKLTLSIEPKYLSLSREERHSSAYGGGEFDCRDISVEFVQSREFKTIFEFYVRERVGRIYDEGASRAVTIPLDSSAYFQIKPGITCRPARGGVAEISYAFSYVAYTGALDYRMAGGSSGGASHTVTLHGDIRMGNHFSLSGLYRGESIRRIGEKDFAPMTHVFSLLIKAFL